VLNVLVSTPKSQITLTSDKRSKHPAINKFKYETLVMDHIESFNQIISHYRREHSNDKSTVTRMSSYLKGF